LTDTYNAQNVLVGQTDALGHSPVLAFDHYHNPNNLSS